MVVYPTGQNGRLVQARAGLWNDTVAVRSRDLPLAGGNVLNCQYKCAYVEPAMVYIFLFKFEMILRYL
jgi:hypothetical protein